MEISEIKLDIKTVIAIVIYIGSMLAIYNKFNHESKLNDALLEQKILNMQGKMDDIQKKTDKIYDKLMSN